MKKTNLHIVPRPVGNPGLAPADFFLFQFLKKKHREMVLTDKKDLILRVQAIFDETSESILISADLTRIKQLRWVIQNTRE
jgi:hypothetical protein